MSEQHPFEESHAVEESHSQSASSLASQESEVATAVAPHFPKIEVAAPEFVAKTESPESSFSQPAEQAPVLESEVATSLEQAPSPLIQAPQDQPIPQGGFESQNPFPPVNPPSKDKTKQSIILVIGILIGLLIGGVSGYLIGTAVLQHPMVESPDLQDTTDEEELDDLVADDGDNAFTWELTDIPNLVFLTSLDHGESPWETVETYGKAATSNVSGDEVTLTWQQSGSYKTVRASYQKVDGDYQLKDWSADYLPGGNWKQEAKDVSKDLMKNLKVGDSDTGKGGISYKEVIKQYGDVQRLRIYSADYSEVPKLTLDYNLDDGNYAELIFVRQSDGDYLLSETFTY